MSRASRRREDESYREWKGGYRPYDILREATIALVAAHILLVRKHGIVPPFQLSASEAKSEAAAKPSSASEPQS